MDGARRAAELEQLQQVPGMFRRAGFRRRFRVRPEPLPARPQSSEPLPRPGLDHHDLCGGVVSSHPRWLETAKYAAVTGRFPPRRILPAAAQVRRAPPASSLLARRISVRCRKRQAVAAVLLRELRLRLLRTASCGASSARASICACLACNIPEGSRAIHRNHSANLPRALVRESLPEAGESVSL